MDRKNISLNQINPQDQLKLLSKPQCHSKKHPKFRNLKNIENSHYIFKTQPY